MHADPLGIIPSLVQVGMTKALMFSCQHLLLKGMSSSIGRLIASHKDQVSLQSP